LIACATPTVADPPDTLAWTRQFGTTGNESVTGIAAADGNAYVSGYTSGALEGIGVGGVDAFVRSHSAADAHRWTRQFGTGSNDLAMGIAADEDGNVYAAGFTQGDLEGPSAGGIDAFVRSYDSDGNHRWTRQFGTDSDEEALAIATDADGNVYAAGWTLGVLEGVGGGGMDLFVRSYDGDGNHRWTRQFGSGDYDEMGGVAADADGNVYAAGMTFGDLEGDNMGSFDAFVRSYDGNGALRWTRQYGTDKGDYASGIAADAAGNVYAGGHTLGDLGGANAGFTDAFVRMYDGSGTHRWTRQFGTDGDESIYSLATAANGNIFVGGWTGGALEGANAGSADAYLRSFDGSGVVRWTRQFGTTGSDEVRGVATDPSGNVYAAGITFGDLDGVNAGAVDGFIRRYGP
jgi:hypothetical protein